MSYIYIMNTPRTRRSRRTVSGGASPACFTPNKPSTSFSVMKPSTSASTTPVPKAKYSHQGSSSSLYSGSKYTDSPMAKHLPAPPCMWLKDFDRPASVPNGWRMSPTPSVSSGSVRDDSSDSGNTTSSDEPMLSELRPRQVRVHPLQLIALAVR